MLSFSLLFDLFSSVTPLVVSQPTTSSLLLASQSTPTTSRITPFDLARPLSARTSNSFDLVQGKQLDLSPFTLTVLSNETHVQATFNVSQPLDSIGWIALGLGTQMSDSAMVILWPSTESIESTWIISHRFAMGHTQPVFDSSVVTSTSIGRWQLVRDLTTFDQESDRHTLVTISRTLELPSSQQIYPPEKLKYANFTRASLSKMKNTKNKLIYAASDEKPPFDREGSLIMMHEPKMFGSTQIDLSKRFFKSSMTSTNSTLGTQRGGSTEVDIINGVKGSDIEIMSVAWTKYDRIIAAHATFAMLAWLLIAPTAVLIARLGRSWGNWFRWHSRLQIVGTYGSVIVAMSLGLWAAASNGTIAHLDSHKTLGIVLILVTTFQLTLGFLSHSSHLSSSARTSTRPFVRVFHILTGIVTMPLAWTTISFGIEEWKEKRPSVCRPLGIVLYVGIALFLVPYVLSLVVLSFRRIREGRTLYYALFGLGRSSASPRGGTREWAEGRFSQYASSAGGGGGNRNSLTGGAGAGGNNGGQPPYYRSTVPTLPYSYSSTMEYDSMKKPLQQQQTAGGGSPGGGSVASGGGGIKRRSLSGTSIEVTVVDKDGNWQIEGEGIDQGDEASISSFDREKR